MLGIAIANDNGKCRGRRRRRESGFGFSVGGVRPTNDGRRGFLRIQFILGAQDLADALGRNVLRILVVAVIESDVSGWKTMIERVLAHFHDGARVDASLAGMDSAPKYARALVADRVEMSLCLGDAMEFAP